MFYYLTNSSQLKSPQMRIPGHFKNGFISFAVVLQVPNDGGAHKNIYFLRLNEKIREPLGILVLFSALICDDCRNKWRRAPPPSTTTTPPSIPPPPSLTHSPLSRQPRSPLCKYSSSVFFPHIKILYYYCKCCCTVPGSAGVVARTGAPLSGWPLRGAGSARQLRPLRALLCRELRDVRTRLGTGS